MKNPADASRRTVASLLLLLVPALAAAQGPPASPAAAGGPEAEVRAAEARRFAAMVKGDVTELSPLLADDLTYVHSSGKRESKAQFLAGIASGALRYESIEADGIEVRLYGDVALVNGRAAVKVKTDGRPLDVQLLYTDVYVRRDGRWLLAAWQSTRVPEPTPVAAGH